MSDTRAYSVQACAQQHALQHAATPAGHPTWAVYAVPQAIYATCLLLQHTGFIYMNHCTGGTQQIQHPSTPHDPMTQTPHEAQPTIKQPPRAVCTAPLRGCHAGLCLSVSGVPLVTPTPNKALCSLATTLTASGPWSLSAAQKKVKNPASSAIRCNPRLNMTHGNVTQASSDRHNSTKPTDQKVAAPCRHTTSAQASKTQPQATLATNGGCDASSVSPPHLYIMPHGVSPGMHVYHRLGSRHMSAQS